MAMTTSSTTTMGITTGTNMATHLRPHAPPRDLRRTIMLGTPVMGMAMVIPIRAARTPDG